MRKFGMFKESVSMSLSNIRSNKMRTFLTTLGVLIGVTAVIALVTVMEGATDMVKSEFSALGTGKLTVSVTGTALKSGLNTTDLQILNEVDNVAGISPSVSMTSKVKSDHAWAEDISLNGYGAAYFTAGETGVSRGRLLNQVDQDECARVCLVDKTLCQKIFFGEDPLGQTIYISGNRYTVVGVLTSSESKDVMSQAMGVKEEGKVILPYTTLQKITGGHLVSSLTVYIEDSSRQSETADLLDSTLASLFNGKDDAYSVINMESLMSTMDTMLNMMTVLLTGIAAISLLVGGIGIMNMMLVSVVERTAEIGLRKALGAEPWEIQMQFLIEAFILSVLGGVIGTILGLLLSWLMAGIIGMQFTISMNAIVLGAGFSAAVGLLFGWAPARKASRLNPIDALRSN